MPITDYYTWDWNKLHLLTSQSRDLIRRYFAPFNDAGELYDPDTLASIIVEP